MLAVIVGMDVMAQGVGYLGEAVEGVVGVEGFPVLQEAVPALLSNLCPSMNGKISGKMSGKIN